MCMWGDHSCSADFAGNSTALGTCFYFIIFFFFYKFELVFSAPSTLLHGCEWNLAEMLHHKSRCACGEIIHVRQIFQLWPLAVRRNVCLITLLLLWNMRGLIYVLQTFCSFMYSFFIHFIFRLLTPQLTLNAQYQLNGSGYKNIPTLLQTCHTKSNREI